MRESINIFGRLRKEKAYYITILCVVERNAASEVKTGMNMDVFPGG